MKVCNNILEKILIKEHHRCVRVPFHSDCVCVCVCVCVWKGVGGERERDRESCKVGATACCTKCTSPIIQQYFCSTSTTAQGSKFIKSKSDYFLFGMTQIIRFI